VGLNRLIAPPPLKFFFFLVPVPPLNPPTIPPPLPLAFLNIFSGPRPNGKNPESFWAARGPFPSFSPSIGHFFGPEALAFWPILEGSTGGENQFGQSPEKKPGRGPPPPSSTNAFFFPVPLNSCKTSIGGPSEKKFRYFSV